MISRQYTPTPVGSGPTLYVASRAIFTR
jgi:hypothetical protein